MKHLFLLFLGVVFTASIAKAQTCYVTETGTKYHANSCVNLKYSKHDIDLKQALEFGFTACRVCKPTKDKLLSESKQGSVNSFKGSNSNYQSYSGKSSGIKRRANAVRCSGKTKLKERCKRLTRSRNGKCYQHQPQTKKKPNATME